MNDSDNKISHKFAYSGANKLKIISDKYENSFWNQNLSSDEDFFQTQKKFRPTLACKINSSIHKY